MAEDVRQEIVTTAMEFLALNKECYIAQWVVQNPEENIKDYSLVQENMEGGGFRFYLEKKEKLYARGMY
jgi:hypothetical protein